MSQLNPNSIERVRSYIDEAGRDRTDGNEYRGLQIHAWPGLHDYVGGKIRQLLPAGARVLDLAAGTGAMSLRLRDMGFEVTAVDLVAENFRLRPAIPFVPVDLNGDFSKELPPSCDGIVALEIIEHLENPRHFLRECYRCLRPGGVLTLSTPNTNSPLAKAHFMRFGAFQWFTQDDYRTRGHITPVSYLQLRQCADEIGFAIVSLESFGDPYDTAAGWWKMRWFARVLSPFSKQEPGLERAILLAALRRPAVELRDPGRIP